MFQYVEGRRGKVCDDKDQMETKLVLSSCWGTARCQQEGLQFKSLMGSIDVPLLPATRTAAIATESGKNIAVSGRYGLTSELSIYEDS